MPATLKQLSDEYQKAKAKNATTATSLLGLMICDSVKEELAARDAVEKDRAIEIDVDWLRAIGFTPDDDDDEFHSIVRLRQLSVCLDDVHGATSWCLRGACLMTEIKTRGQVIDLFAGLNYNINKPD